MKNKIINTIAISAALFAFAGCQDAGQIDNMLYITGAKYEAVVPVKPNSTTDSREFTVGIAQPVDHTIKVGFTVEPDLVDNYRHAYYSPDAELLPTRFYYIEKLDTEITPGNVSSTPIEVRFKNLGEMDRDKVYVLPVTVYTLTGIDVLSTADTYYFVCKGAALINVVPDMKGGNWAWPDFDGFTEVKNMQSYSFETLLYANTFYNEISTVMGIEGKFLIRLGDATKDPNMIQLVTPVGSIDITSKRLKTKQWYHLAVTVDLGQITVYLDGEVIHSEKKNMSGIDLSIPHSDEDSGKPRCFWVGYSYSADRYFDGQFSEVRIWNRALTKAEINEPLHPYDIDPDSPGLAAYWKMDDGGGTTAKDYTQYGHDLTFNSDPLWVGVSLP